MLLINRSSAGVSKVKANASEVCWSVAFGRVDATPEGKDIRNDNREPVFWFPAPLWGRRRGVKRPLPNYLSKDCLQVGNAQEMSRLWIAQTKKMNN